MPGFEQQETTSRTEAGDYKILEDFRTNPENPGTLIYNPIAMSTIQDITTKINHQEPASTHPIIPEDINIEGGKLFTVDISGETKVDIPRTKFIIIFSETEIDDSYSNLSYDDFLRKLASTLTTRGYAQENIVNLLNVFGKYCHQDGFLNMGQSEVDILARTDGQSISWGQRPAFIINFSQFKNDLPLVLLEEKFIIKEIYPAGEFPPSAESTEEIPPAAECKLRTQLLGKLLQPKELTINILEPEQVKNMIHGFDWVKIDVNRFDVTNYGAPESGPNYHNIDPTDIDYELIHHQDAQPEPAGIIAKTINTVTTTGNLLGRGFSAITHMFSSNTQPTVNNPTGASQPSTNETDSSDGNSRSRGNSSSSISR